MQKRIVSGVVCAALLAACAPDEEPDTTPQPVAEPGQELASDNSTSDLFVDAPPPDAQVIFVGVDTMRAAAQRAGALFVPFSTFSVERNGIPNEFPPADSLAALLRAAGVRGGPVMIVGEPIPAGRAWAAFDYLGMADRAVLFDGGPGAFSTTTASTSTPSAADLEVNARNEMIVDAAWVNAHLNDASVVILDARPPAEYTGATSGEGVTRPGHIAGARNLFWQTLVRSPTDTRLKDEAELRRIFEQAGVAPGKTIVAYCRTGGQSSFLYAVARHLGYDVRLYDGSFVDWSRTTYPVER
jgi:thiosulfate/3-mercaptopyruvate sulfurtransferase